MSKYYNDIEIKARFELHKKTSVVKIVGLGMGNYGLRNFKPGIKKEIKEWSARSQRAAKLKFEDLSEYMETEIVLTYPLGDLPSLDGIKIKKHLNSFLQVLRVKYGSTFLYAWVLEYTKNGCPHYHLMINKPVYDGMHEWLLKRWHSITKIENPDHLLHGVHVATIRHKDGYTNYMVKYLEKQAQKAVPESFKNCGRFWGCSRSAPKPQIIEIGFTRQRENLSGEYDCLRVLRPFRKHHEAKIKNLNKQRIAEGKRPLKPRTKTGFTCWGGVKACKELLGYIVPF